MAEEGTLSDVPHFDSVLNRCLQKLPLVYGYKTEFKKSKPRRHTMKTY